MTFVKKMVLNSRQIKLLLLVLKNTMYVEIIACLYINVRIAIIMQEKDINQLCKKKACY